MSLPAWAMAPESGARKPILIGVWATASSARVNHVKRTIATRASDGRMKLLPGGKLGDLPGILPERQGRVNARGAPSGEREWRERWRELSEVLGLPDDGSWRA